MTEPSRQKIRELIMQMLYSHEQLRGELSDMLPLLQELLHIPESSLPQIEQRYAAILSKQSLIDKLITQYSLEFSFERIQSIEKAILRQAVFELLFDTSANEKIIISEAIRLCNKFCSSDAIAFINGILDTIYQKQKDQNLLLE